MCNKELSLTTGLWEFLAQDDPAVAAAAFTAFLYPMKAQHAGVGSLTMQTSINFGLKCSFLAILFVTRSQPAAIQLADVCLVVTYAFKACIMLANKPVIASADKTIHMEHAYGHRHTHSMQSTSHGRR